MPPIKPIDAYHKLQTMAVARPQAEGAGLSKPRSTNPNITDEGAQNHDSSS